MRVVAAGAAAGWPPEGIAAALVETDGRAIFALGEGFARGWSEPELARIGQPGQGEGPGAARDETVEMALGMVLDGLDGWSVAGLLAPAGTAPSGAVLAEALGRDVVWNFDAADRAMGGLGGAEDAFFHHALLRCLGIAAPSVVLDLGAVARLTWADPRITDPAAPGACLAFDAGPGVLAEDAELAGAGSLPEGRIEAALDLPFFARMPPRRYQPLAELAALTADLSPEDAAATAAAIAAAGVVQALDLCPEPPAVVLVCGPGRRHDPALRMIAAGATLPVRRFEELELDGDLTRAQAAAYCAARALAGLPGSAPGTTGVAAPVGGAEVARPSRVAKIPPIFEQ